jgi:caa(3)-type oxidase subunit IV
MAAPVYPIKLYVTIYIILLCLLAVTISFAFIDIGRYPNNGIAEFIPCVKTLLIVYFFMHLKDERWITWVFAGAGVLWLCIMLTLTMNDYLTRNHPAQSSPKGEPVFVSRQ